MKSLGIARHCIAKNRTSIVAALAFVLFFGFAWSVRAQFLKNPFQKPEPATIADLALSEQHGPWMILVTTFSGDQGQQRANSLALELRQTLRVPTFVFGQKFEHDYTKEVQPSRNPYALRKQFNKAGTVKEYVVLVGHYDSVDDTRFKKHLKAIKNYSPSSTNKQLEYVQNVGSHDVSDWRLVVGKNKPFYLAFGVRNPLLPPENQQGAVDAFVESLNADRDYSLLKNPHPYTVQIATFTGKVVHRQNEIAQILRTDPSKSGPSDLELGEQAAVRLCKALRKRGIAAYEFHDRYASYVAVGGFDSYGEHLPNGQIEINPEMKKVIDYFQAKPAPFHQTGAIGYQPKTFDGVECDVQPRVIMVPRKMSQR